MVDLLAFGASVLEFTPADHARLETADRLDVSVTGPESNAAIAANRLGVEAAWLSKLPATPLGRRVTSALGAHGVETAVRWSDEGRQGLTFAERTGPPQGHTRIHDRMAAVASATPDELPLSDVGGASMVYASGATVALSETLAGTTTALFGETDIETRVLSLSRQRAFESPAAREAVASLLPATDLLLTTEPGAAALDHHGDPPETVHALASAHDLETVVLARGERGAMVWHDTTVHEHAPPDTETADERGAFDALCGGFLARRLAGEKPDRALAAGVACAALARTVQGPVPVVTRGEVERCVESMGAPGIGE